MRGASDGEELPRFFMVLHIGKEIQRVMELRGQTVVGLAREYGCSRIHMYRIFDKSSIDTAMLLRFSLILKYDFFQLYQQEYNAKKECVDTKNS